ncbi:hypothetical protein [Verrucosispora sp. NA02020]|uniref:hypothetical protein n=1 Tax=Verrucosispora sp. NA02020 TaxID=2742132 RepID=UPI0015929782|nr:hypothetical protein [Verrucosispora sp. NA02020]QKW15403.1 hypothetical protein HUT12_23300 [Verrucosispora sp. NA02020]
MTATATANYTWTASTRYCSTEAHRDQPTCPDCTNIGTCAGCTNTITDGTAHMVCNENGEAAHSHCRKAAEQAWGDDYY